MSILVEVHYHDHELYRFNGFGPANPGDAGIDLRCSPVEVTILPGQCVIVGTGVAVNMPSSDMVGLVFPRSGAGINQGIVLGNAVGVIDSGYQGEIKCGIWNRNVDKTIVLKRGDRIAQLVFVPCLTPSIVLKTVQGFSTASVRGEGGFGSTGKN